MRIYTAGHSNHSFEFFLSLLKQHGITCVVDVRTVPASRFNPHFNKKQLCTALKNSGIYYLHFQNEFGARRTEQDFLDEKGIVDFEKVAESAAFVQGISRLKTGVQNGNVIALVCAEADPLACHRFGMISRVLTENGFDVLHIQKDGTLLTQGDLEERLLRLMEKKLRKTGIAPDHFLAASYKLLNGKIGFKP